MSEETKNEQVITFFDIIGRTIMGKVAGETDTEILVKNPAVVNIEQQTVTEPKTGQVVVNPNTGQPVKRMTLQLFPLFFREFLADKNQEVVLKYKRDAITETSEPIILDFKVKAQYEQLFIDIGDLTVNNAPPAAPANQDVKTNDPTADSTPVINLFDEE